MEKETNKKAWEKGRDDAVAFLWKMHETGINFKDRSRIGFYLTATDFGMAEKLKFEEYNQ